MTDYADGGLIEGPFDPDFAAKIAAGCHGETLSAEQVRQLGGLDAVKAFREQLHAEAVRSWDLGPDCCGDRASFPLLRHVLAAFLPEGTGVEFGVAEGTSLAMIAAHMPAVGFDSFHGLPEDWCEYPAGSRTLGGVPPVINNAVIVPGLFDVTLPAFDFGGIDRIGLVHFDADLYSSTKTALEFIGPHLHDGCYVVFDEWHRAHHDTEQHEPRAWREFLETRPRLGWTVIGHDTEAWAIQLHEVP